MKKLLLYTDRGEVFKYNLVVDGANPSGIKTRLCLEFQNGSNIYFKGRVDESGKCEINIPALRHMEKGIGRAIVEVVADDTYFEIFETEFELKQKIVIKLVESSMETSGDSMSSSSKSSEPSLTIKENRPKVSFSLDTPLVEEDEIEEIINNQVSKVEERMERKVDVPISKPTDPKPDLQIHSSPSAKDLPDIPLILGRKEPILHETADSLSSLDLEKPIINSTPDTDKSDTGTPDTGDPDTSILTFREYLGTK